jgi:hypothetical protein
VKAPDAKVYYLTLSYVWGTEHMVRETGMTLVEIKRAHLRTTKADKEITPLPERLPQMIEDAILPTRSLGFRY